MGDEKKAPVMKLASGTIKVAVWENRYVYEGKEKTAHQVTVHRSYIDPKTRQWKDTNSIAAKDLLVAAALLQEVFKTLQIRQLEGKKSAAPAGDDGPPLDEGSPHGDPF